MKVLMLNGSPKGENSVTLQTVRYLELLHPEHTFEVLHVGARIKGLERDFAPAVHLDYDESNACGFRDGDYGRILT